MKNNLRIAEEKHDKILVSLCNKDILFKIIKSLPINIIDLDRIKNFKLDYEIESPIRNKTGRVIGFADILVKLSYKSEKGREYNIDFYFEIKTHELIGNIIRQIKGYREELQSEDYSPIFVLVMPNIQHKQIFEKEGILTYSVKEV